MTYVHFDREAVAEAMQKAATASYELALKAAPDEKSRDYVRAQHRFTKIVAESYAVCIDLRNEGVSEEVVAAAVGANLGAIIAVVLMNSNEHRSCASRLNFALNSAVESAICGGRDHFTTAGHVYVEGEPGGRA